MPQLSASFCFSTGTESLFQAKSLGPGVSPTSFPLPHLSQVPSWLHTLFPGPCFPPAQAGATLGKISSSSPLLLPFPLAATPVFANQLTACSVIAHEKTREHMWWGDRGTHKMRFLFSKQTPKFNYSLNKWLLKPSSLCCCSSPHCLLALHY